MAIDMVIELEDEPGSLAKVAAALSDAGVNISAATAINGHGAELHVLVPKAEPVRHALAAGHKLSISREREVAVVQCEDRPGELADLAGRIASAGVNLDLVYIATGSRVVFGSPDLEALKKALGDHLSG